MRFTDDQIKVLKESEAFNDIPWVMALVARLEAAEAVCREVDETNARDRSWMTELMRTAFEAWRKSKGERFCLDGEPCGEGCGCTETSKGETE